MARLNWTRLSTNTRQRRDIDAQAIELAKMKTEHLEHQKQQAKEAGAPLCPDCESQMLPRKGPYGEFFGCSRFPNCRGVKR